MGQKVLLGENERPIAFDKGMTVWGAASLAEFRLFITNDMGSRVATNCEKN